MKRVFLFIGVAVLLAYATAFGADQTMEPNGFGGIKWRTNIHDVQGMTNIVHSFEKIYKTRLSKRELVQLREKSGCDMFTCKRLTVKAFSRVPPEIVDYLFVSNQFYGVKFVTVGTHYELYQDLQKMYGSPSHKIKNQFGTQIYQWFFNNVQIDYTISKYRDKFYMTYRPLADRKNDMFFRCTDVYRSHIRQKQ